MSGAVPVSEVREKLAEITRSPVASSSPESASQFRSTQDRRCARAALGPRYDGGAGRPARICSTVSMRWLTIGQTGACRSRISRPISELTYRIGFFRPAEKDLRGIRDGTMLRRLSVAIEALSDNRLCPMPGKMRNVGDVWRIRVGNWRICYAIEDGRLVIRIVTVAQRGDVHERLLPRLGR